MALAIGTALAGGAAGAATLLTNGSFSGSTAGWSTNPGYFLAFDALDATGAPGSGSARLRGTGAQANLGYGVTQCIPVTAGVTYRLGGRVYLPLGQSSSGFGHFSVLWHGQPNCGGNYIGGTSTSSVSAIGAWQGVSKEVVAPGGSVSAQVLLQVVKSSSGGSFDALYDDVVFGRCVDSPQTLCLNGGRFLVSVTWETHTGGTGAGQSVPLRADSGLFWFFGPDNLELLVKVLNGCALNARYWLFAAGTTNVGYAIRVTDTQTGQSKTWTNPVDRISPATTDTGAFATCP